MTQTAAWKAETEADVMAPFALVRMDLPSGTVRLHSGIGDVSWDSQTWTGAGDLGFISAIESETELRAGNVTIGLSGLNSSIKADALDSLARGSDVYIYYGFFDTSSGAVVVDPWLGFFGQVDQPTVAEDDEGVTISVDCLDGVGAMLRQTIHYRTAADQEAIFTGDKVFEFVGDDSPVTWGASGDAQVRGSTAPTPIRGGTNLRLD